MGICGSSPKTRGGDESAGSGGRMGKRQESVTNKSLVLLGEAESHSKSIRSVAIVLEGKLRRAPRRTCASPSGSSPYVRHQTWNTCAGQSPAALNLPFPRPGLASHPAPQLVLSAPFRRDRYTFLATPSTDPPFNPHSTTSPPHR